MRSSVSAPTRITTAVLLGAMLVSGCSGSDDREPVETPGTAPGETPGSDPGTAPDGEGSDALQPTRASLELVADKTFRISWQPVRGAVSYRVLENADGAAGFSPISDELDASTQVFDHRVALYSRVNARYVVQACNAAGCVDSDEVIVSGALEPAVGYFKPESAGIGFGDAVALSADGTTLAVGGFSNVHVFARADGRWQQQTRLEGFGGAIGLSADGATLAIGDLSDSSAATGVNGDREDDSAADAGAVHVFVRTDGDWRRQAYLKAANTGAGDRFGETVALSADGDTLAIGARKEDSAASGIDGEAEDDSVEDSGAAYVFVRRGGDWEQSAYLKASTVDPTNDTRPEDNFVRFGDEFGGALDLSADGRTLAVGARFEDSAATGVDGDQTNNAAGSSGAVYVFLLGGDTWSQQAYLKASNTEGADGFGLVVGLSADGGTLAVGAPAEASAATGVDGDQNDNSAPASGAVYVFLRDGEGWRQQAFLKAGNTDENDLFGGALSLDDDGDTLAVGAISEDSGATGIGGDATENAEYVGSSASAGAVYVFRRGEGIWRQQAYVKASNTGQADELCEITVEDRVIGIAGDEFGAAVGLSGDGETLAVAAPSECSAASGFGGDQLDDSTAGAGAVYLY